MMAGWLDGWIDGWMILKGENGGLNSNASHDLNNRAIRKINTLRTRLIFSHLELGFHGIRSGGRAEPDVAVEWRGGSWGYLLAWVCMYNLAWLGLKATLRNKQQQQKLESLTRGNAHRIPSLGRPDEIRCNY